VTADRSPRAFVVLSLALLAAGCSRPVAEEVTSETPVPVRTEAVSVGDMRGVVHATAIVTPSPGAEMIVVAPEASRIVEMPRAAGDRVRRGEVLVRFEIPTSVADVQRQQAEMARAQAMLESARAAQTRAGELFERGVAARREVEDANRAAADAEAALAQAKAALRSAETVAARATVRAEFDGIVARRLHNPGDLVEATAADVVLRVVDPQRLELIAAVPISDAPRVAVGATARLSGERSSRARRRRCARSGSRSSGSRSRARSTAATPCASVPRSTWAAERARTRRGYASSASSPGRAASRWSRYRSTTCCT